jgi:hypothetical protein
VDFDEDRPPCLLRRLEVGWRIGDCFSRKDRSGDGQARGDSASEELASGYHVKALF